MKREQLPAKELGKAREEQEEKGGETKGPKRRTDDLFHSSFHTAASDPEIRTRVLELVLAVCPETGRLAITSVVSLDGVSERLENTLFGASFRFVLCQVNTRDIILCSGPVQSGQIKG